MPQKHTIICDKMGRQSGYLTIGLAIALAVASLAVMGLWHKIGALQQECPLW